LASAVLDLVCSALAPSRWVEKGTRKKVNARTAATSCAIPKSTNHQIRYSTTSISTAQTTKGSGTVRSSGKSVSKAKPINTNPRYRKVMRTGILSSFKVNWKSNQETNSAIPASKGNTYKISLELEKEKKTSG